MEEPIVIPPELIPFINLSKYHKKFRTKTSVKVETFRHRVIYEKMPPHVAISTPAHKKKNGRNRVKDNRIDVIAALVRNKQPLKRADYQFYTENRDLFEGLI